MPINYKNYPSNWKSELRPAILKRAENKCEHCGVPNYSIVRWDSEHGKYILYKHHYIYSVMDYQQARQLCIELQAGHYYDNWKVIVLTVAHLDHDITNNEFANLRALCQRCHLNYDREDNHRRRRYGKHFERDQLKIFKNA